MSGLLDLESLIFQPVAAEIPTRISRAAMREYRSSINDLEGNFYTLRGTDNFPRLFDEISGVGMEFGESSPGTPETRSDEDGASVRDDRLKRH